MNKDCQKVIARYDVEILRMHSVLSVSMRGVDVVLSNPIDENGEFISQPFVERLREITSEIMSIIRNHSEGGPVPTKKESLWKE